MTGVLLIAANVVLWVVVLPVLVMQRRARILRALEIEWLLPQSLPPMCPDCGHTGDTGVYDPKRLGPQDPTYARGYVMRGHRSAGVADHIRFGCFVCDGAVKLSVRADYPLFNPERLA